MKRVTTGAYIMSAAHQSPNRKSPVPPKRARACAHSCRIRSISSVTSFAEILGWVTFADVHRQFAAKVVEARVHFRRHRPRHPARAIIFGPVTVPADPIREELDDRQAVPHDAFTVPQDRHLAERRGEFVALAPLLPFRVEHRDDIFLEFLARLLARQPAAHGPAGIGPIADDQLKQGLRPYVVAASRIAVLNSAMPLPVSLDVVKMAGCAAGCFAASTMVVS